MKRTIKLTIEIEADEVEFNDENVVDANNLVSFLKNTFDNGGYKHKLSIVTEEEYDE